MQDAASVLTDRLAEVLARLPADLDLDDLAMESKAIQRRREVVDGAALLRIALARGQAVFRCARLRPGRRCRGSPNSATQASNTGWTRRRSFSPPWWNGCLRRNSPARSCAGPAAHCASLTAPASASRAASARTGACTACLTSAAAGSRISN